MTTKERRMVKNREVSIDLEYYTLAGALAEISTLIADYGPDATIGMETEAYSDSDQEYMYVYTSRPETDKEYEIRVALEEQYAKNKEAWDRKEFERLQAKFG